MANEKETKVEPKAEILKVDHSAQELAKMAFDAKAAISNKLNPDPAKTEAELMPGVFAAHKAYLKAVSKGAEVPAKDADFVSQHLAQLKKKFPQLS